MFISEDVPSSVLSILVVLLTPSTVTNQHKLFCPHSPSCFLDIWYPASLTVDIIVDAVGKSKTLNHVLPLLKKSGKIGVYGLDEHLDYKIDTSIAKGDFTYYNGEIYDEGSVHDEIINFIQNEYF